MRALEKWKFWAKILLSDQLVLSNPFIDTCFVQATYFFVSTLISRRVAKRLINM